MEWGPHYKENLQEYTHPSIGQISIMKNQKEMKSKKKITQTTFYLRPHVNLKWTKSMANYQICEHFICRFWKPEAVFWLVTREPSSLTLETAPGAVFGSLEPFMELLPIPI